MTSVDSDVRVSVITPCYKTDDYITSFLSGLQGQTLFPRFEVVLDMNAPSGGEMEALAHAERTLGSTLVVCGSSMVDPISVSMNRAVEHSQSEYIAIWNVDDRRAPWSLEVQAEYLDAHPEVVAVGGPFRVVRSLSSKTGRLVKGKIPDRYELTRGMYLGPFFMFRRRAFEEVGRFDEQFRSGADYDLAVRLSFAGEIGAVECLLGDYLNEGRGASTRPGSLQQVERTAIELRYGAFDKVDVSLLPRASEYVLPMLLQGDQWIPLRDLLPAYEGLLRQRQALSPRPLTFRHRLRGMVRSRLTGDGTVRQY